MLTVMLLPRAPRTPRIEACGAGTCWRKGANKKEMGAFSSMSIEGQFQKPAHLAVFCCVSLIWRALCCASFCLSARLCLFFAQVYRKTAQTLFLPSPFSLSLYIIEKKEERGGIKGCKRCLGGARVFAWANKQVREFWMAAQLKSRTFAQTVGQCFSHFYEFKGRVRGCAEKSAPASFEGLLK